MRAVEKSRHRQAAFGANELSKHVAVHHHALDQSRLNVVEIKLAALVKGPRDIAVAVLEPLFGLFVKSGVGCLRLRN